VTTASLRQEASNRRLRGLRRPPVALPPGWSAREGSPAARCDAKRLGVRADEVLVSLVLSEWSCRKGSPRGHGAAYSPVRALCRGSGTRQLCCSDRGRARPCQPACLLVSALRAVAFGRLGAGLEGQDPTTSGRPLRRFSGDVPVSACLPRARRHGRRCQFARCFNGPGELTSALATLVVVHLAVVEGAVGHSVAEWLVGRCPGGDAGLPCSLCSGRAFSNSFRLGQLAPPRERSAGDGGLLPEGRPGAGAARARAGMRVGRSAVGVLSELAFSREGPSAPSTPAGTLL